MLERSSDYKTKFNNLKFEKLFFITLGVLLITGIIMVYSSSYMYAKEVKGSSIYFLLRQIIFTALGLGIAYLISKTKLNFWYKNSLILNIIVTFLVFLTLIPGIGMEIKGSFRWLHIGSISFQPAEILKYSLMLCSYHFFSNFFELSKKQKIIHVTFLILPLILLLLQPDFGTFTISLFIIFFVCFLSEFPRKWFYGIFISSILLTLPIFFLASYRIQRLLTFLDPWKDPQKSGFQIIQSYLAFAHGSIFGQGIGNSNEKLFYLPEAYNDFIFSVMGEELGFIGVCLLVFLFMFFIFLGIRLALESKNKHLVILMVSIITIIGLQAFLNMGVVLGLLPTKGLNLPFISYGGTSLISNLGAIGLYFSAKKESELNYVI